MGHDDLQRRHTKLWHPWRIIRANSTVTFRSEITGSGGLTKSGGLCWNSRGSTSTLGSLLQRREKSESTPAKVSVRRCRQWHWRSQRQHRPRTGSGVVVEDESLELLIGGNLVIDQNNTWKGDILINSNFETGQPNNATIQVNDNGSLIIDGRITGMSAALGGINGDFSYTGNNESRGPIFTNGGSAFSSVRNGIIRINGAITDEDFVGGGRPPEAQPFVRGYTERRLQRTAASTYLEDSTCDSMACWTSGFWKLCAHERGIRLGWRPGGAGTGYGCPGCLTGGLALFVNTITGLTVGTVITGPGIELRYDHRCRGWYQ